MAKVYLQTFTSEDIKFMIAFYESPTGKKIHDFSGIIAEKSQAIGQEWRKIIQEIISKYTE